MVGDSGGGLLPRPVRHQLLRGAARGEQGGDGGGVEEAEEGDGGGEDEG